MPQRFLILGGNSFYGANFAELVKRKGDEVDLYCRPAFDLLVDKTWRWLRMALEAGPDYVVNFMSKSLVAESWDAPQEWIATNVAATNKLFDFLRLHDCKKYIHVSTPEVYGSTFGWVDEGHPFDPTTPYAVTRAAADMMLKAYHKAYGFPVVITRTANIYGPWQKDRIIPKAFSCKSRGEILPLHGNGESERSFIHVKDACEATYVVAKKGKLGETYHISTPKSHSIMEVVEMIGCEYEFVPDRLGKDRAYLLNSRKVRNLGWTDTISLEEGLRECEQLISA
jgi:dTDP-glucose 4,6-dehydratase